MKWKQSQKIGFNFAQEQKNIILILLKNIAFDEREESTSLIYYSLKG